MTVLLEFIATFLFILVFGYIAPAGFYYWAYHLRESKTKEALRIQLRRPKPDGIRREIRMSVISVLIFSVLTTGMLELYKVGGTSIYRNPRQYGLFYLPVSVFLCMVLHDTFFYWSHRFMHWRPVFKYLHAGHHRSISPTPWAIFAFQPGEAIIQYIGMATIVILLPMHWLALLIFFWLDTQMNTAGHTGYEVVPRSISENPLYKGFNTVTHHDAHHTNMSKNFGSFFNVWDRWMGTFQEGVTPPDAPAPSQVACQSPLTQSHATADPPATDAQETELAPGHVVARPQEAHANEHSSTLGV